MTADPETGARDIKLFNLAIDSKLRSCDLVRLRVAYVAHAGRVLSWATVLQRKSHSPVRFESTEHTRDAVQAWIAAKGLYAETICSPAGNSDLDIRSARTRSAKSGRSNTKRSFRPKGAHGRPSGPVSILPLHRNDPDQVRAAGCLLVSGGDHNRVACRDKTHTTRLL